MKKKLIAEPVANYIYAKVLRGVDFFKSQVKEKEGADAAPSLATILVGEDPGSSIYVRKKGQMSISLGFKHLDIKLPSNVDQPKLMQTILKLNNDSSVDGILVQKPLPPHIDERAVLDMIDPNKDVDCFSPRNVGLLTQGRGVLLPCTPAGIIEMMNYYEINPEGKKCLILGRSEIVGKPLALLLLSKNATITVAHSKTQNLNAEVESADLIFAAIGRAHFLNGKFKFKKDAYIFDVGINRIAEKKVVGDVDFEAVFPLVEGITPVPGGVGPMTIAMLMLNTLKAAMLRRKIEFPPGF